LGAGLAPPAVNPGKLYNSEQKLLEMVPRDRVAMKRLCEDSGFRQGTALAVP
jgi:hypothetical protein